MFFMVNFGLRIKGNAKWKYIKAIITVEYTEFLERSAHCDLSRLSGWPDLWFLMLLKTSDTCSQPELWHSCSSSSLEPLHWTQPGPSRWAHIWLTNQITLPRQGKTASSCQPGNPSTTPPETPYHFLSYIREINCKHASGIFLSESWMSWALWRFFRELLLNLLCAQRCFISLRLFC